MEWVTKYAYAEEHPDGVWYLVVVDPETGEDEDLLGTFNSITEAKDWIREEFGPLPEDKM